MNKVRRDSPRQLDHLHRTGAVVFGAVAQHTASPEVAARIHALRDVRRPEERVQRWRASHA